MIDSFRQRREMQKEVDRQGETVDPADRCGCHCGQIHWKRKAEKPSEQDFEQHMAELNSRLQD